MKAANLSRRDRIEYIDLLRAFCIIMMIMGHVSFGGVFNKWIHIFHVPVFFVISGYFHKDYQFRDLIKKKSKVLLLPYYSIGIISIMLNYLMIRRVDIQAFYPLLWENTAEKGIPIAGALWFLTAMFWSELFFWFIQHLKMNSRWKTLSAAIIALLGMGCSVLLPFRLPLALDVGMVGVGFYQLGKTIKGKCSQILELNFAWSLIGLIVFSGIGFANSYVNLRQGHYGIWPLFWISATGIAIMLWNLSRFVYAWGNQNRFLKRVFSWIQMIGCDSIVFLCFNQLAILYATQLVHIFFNPGHGFGLLLAKVAIFAVAMIELFIIRAIVMNTKIKMIFGK